MKASKSDKRWIAANAHKWKPTEKITREGQACRKCNTPVRKIEREPAYKPKANSTLFYLWWLKCPRCGTVYLIDEAKRFTADVEGSKANLDDLFEFEIDKPVPSAAQVKEDVPDAWVDDGLPPWD